MAISGGFAWLPKAVAIVLSRAIVRLGGSAKGMSLCREKNELGNGEKKNDICRVLALLPTANSCCW